MTSPFLTEAALARWPGMHSRAVMASMSALFAASSGAVLFMADGQQLAAVLVCCAAAGAFSAAIEVLVFHHTSQITTAAKFKLAADLGAILYTLVYCTGNTIGGMVGGAVAHMDHSVAAYVNLGLAVLTGSYGVGLCGLWLVSI